MKYTTLLFSALAVRYAALSAQETPPQAPVGVVAPPALPAPSGPRLLDKIPDGTPPPPAPPKPPFIVAPEHVRDSKTIQQGGRTITLQRIDPIALPPQPAPAAPPTAEERAAFAQRAAAFRATHPREHFLQLGATISLSQNRPPRTLVRLWPGDGAEPVGFWSNADFRLIAGLNRFADSTGVIQRLFLMWSVMPYDRGAAFRAARGRVWPPPVFPVFPGEDATATFDPNAVPGPATFIPTGDAVATPAQLATISELHQLYNNERVRLHTAYQSREVARAALEAELKAHPPMPKDITVRYWLKTTAPEIPDPTPYLPQPASPPQPRRPRSLRRRTGFQPVMESGLPACFFQSSICRHLAAVLFLSLLALLPARAALDTNDNGVSDIWELDTHSGQLFPTFDPAADDDHDGWTNRAEAIAGTLHTNPTPPAGIFKPDFRIAPAVYQTVDGTTTEKTPESFVLTFTGLPGKLYTVEHSTDLVTWSIMGNPILSNGTQDEAGQPIADGPKNFFRVNIADIDTDQDRLADWEEYRSGTNPSFADTDYDGATDKAELEWRDPNHPALRLAPLNPDTDGDELTDGDEVLTHHTNPALWDTDGDSLGDGEEIYGLLTDRLLTDTDGDWIDDGSEANSLILHSRLLDPLDPADGLLDFDDDFLLNQLEFVFAAEGFDMYEPNDAATFPWDGDPDGDGETTAQEWTATIRTHPKNPDTDGDGLPDDWERLHALDPTSATGDHGTDGDPDSDGLFNFDEWLNGTDPRLADTDGDGRNDGLEVAQATDPNRIDAAPPDPTVPLADSDTPVPQFEAIPFTVDDPSDSHSERWKMTITGKGPDDFRVIALATPGFGALATRTVSLRKWNRYEITLTHLGTSPEQLVQYHQADYDWAATADALPASFSREHTTAASGINNHFMLRHHWLVDNSAAILTTEKHGNDDNLTAYRKTTLVPVDIDDNGLASGVDDLSCTVAPETGGYQQDHWIMAPSGGAAYSDDMLFKTPLPSAPELWITSLIATHAPSSIYLDASSPLVNWQGATTATEDEAPGYLIGPAQENIALPIHLKTMKKRNLSLAVFPVRSLVTDREVPVPDKAAIAAEFNRVYGWQVNAWLRPEDVTVHAQDHLLYVGGSGDGRTFDADLAFFDFFLTMYRDAGADFNIILLDRVKLLSNGAECNGVTAVGSGSFVAVTSHADGRERTPLEICETATHEFGHVCNLGHPDEGAGLGPAPLPGTDRKERLMSDRRATYHGQRLVKAEWDEFEKWAKARPNGDP